MKTVTVDCLEIIAACDLNIGRCKQLDEKIKVYEYVFMVKVISLLWPKVIFISKLKLVFLRKHLIFFDQILYVSF